MFKLNKNFRHWKIYGICLLIACVFFFLFGFNSPIYTFNSEPDYNWFITMGHGLLAGKIPYRDLFEQKGPVVYFVTAFACLFPNPNLIVFFLEIFSMSLFFFFAYRIISKSLNTFYSLTAILVLALAIFTSWSRIRSAATVEEFSLPIYTYFLLCWLEYMTEHKDWNWVRALCLGLCLGLMLWIKFTLVYFILVPMLIWFISNLYHHKYRFLFNNLVMMFCGVIIITIPNIIFYLANHALGDLFHVYFVINLTSYGSTNFKTLLNSCLRSFSVGPLILILIIWGVVRFTIKHRHEKISWLLLIAFLVNYLLLVFSAKGILYYFSGLFPYAVLGCMDILSLIQSKINFVKHQKLIYTIIAVICLAICTPCSILISEWGRSKDDYVPLVVADVIHDYENTNNTKATLFCYKIIDFGFYNAAGIVPNNYFFCNNTFSKESFPEMYQAYNDYITQQTSDFIITKQTTWEKEYDLLSQYYQPYTDTIYHYHQLHYFYYRDIDFILLIKKH